jgi:LysM repeat protein
MRVYRYSKPEKKTRNKVVIKSYTQKIGKLSSIVFSKPFFIATTSAMFIASNYFFVAAFSQVSRADYNEPFRIYTASSNEKKVTNIEFIPNPDLIRELKFEVYIVKSGDTLSSISAATKDSLEEIITNNSLSANNVLKIGQPLKVIKD